MPDYIESTAEFSHCGRYRYALKRRWSDDPACMFLMLNPSTADANLPDPTITRCIGFAQRWGYGALLVGNIFALRSTDPKGLRTLWPVGPLNNQWILKMAEESAIVVAAWGNHGTLFGRSGQVEILMSHFDLMCLGVTSSGEPKHPLYLRSDLVPLFYREASRGTEP